MRRRNYWIVGTCSLAAAVTAIILWAWPEDPSQTTVVGPQSAIADDDAFSVRAWMETNRVDAAKPVRFVLTFVNRYAAATAVSITDLQTPGFRSHAPFHFPANGGAVAFPIAVAPNRSVAIQSELAPGNQMFGRFKLAASYRWERGNASRAGMVSVGPIEITDSFHAAAALIANRFYAAVKDLALPIMIAAFGLALQLSQKNREMRQAIWTTQLPRLHEYAEKHYLPIVRSLRLVLKDYARVKPGPSAPAVQCDETNRYCYELFMFLRRMRWLREDKGGIFFRNRDGERVFQDAWFAFNHNVTAALSEDTYERVLKGFAVTTTFDDFNAALTAAPAGAPDALSDMCLKAVHWLNGSAGSVGPYENCLDLLRILKNVCSFEANRPFDDYWYESPDDFDVRPPEQYVFPTEPAENIALLRRELASYYRTTRSYLRKNQRI